AHLFNLRLIQTRGAFDTNLWLLAGAQIFGRDIENTVVIDVKRDFDLWHAPRRRRNAVQMEQAEQFIVGSHFAFALEDFNRYRRLAILGSREGVLLLYRDGRV